MSERFYLFLVGLYILCALYMGMDMMIYGLSVLLVFEGLTDLRLTIGLQKMRKITYETGLVAFKTKLRFNFDGLRAWRILVAIVLASSYISLHQYNVDFLWFFPWFMGFAIMGAGVSSMCPMLMALRWAGFR